MNVSTTDLAEAVDWCRHCACLLTLMRESEERGEKLTRAEKRDRREFTMKFRQMTDLIREVMRNWPHDEELAN